jgi:nucleoid-associated protein YgaU
LARRSPNRDQEESMENKSQQGGGADEWDATQWHVVQKGETLSKIAEQYYGDPSLYPKIFEANRDILKDPNLIRVGQKLRVP